MAAFRERDFAYVRRYAERLESEGVALPDWVHPLIGPEPVVPVIAISALFTNSSRAVAFLRHVDWRRTLIVLIAAIPTCMLGAYGYTLLTSTGAAVTIPSVAPPETASSMAYS